MHKQQSCKIYDTKYNGTEKQRQIHHYSWGFQLPLPSIDQKTILKTSKYTEDYN